MHDRTLPFTFIIVLIILFALPTTPAPAQQTWQRIDNFEGFPYDVDFRGFTPTGTGEVLLFTGNGVYRTVDSTRQLIQVDSALIATPLGRIDDRLFAFNQSGLFVSDDDGISWQLFLRDDVRGTYLRAGDQILLRDVNLNTLSLVGPDGSIGKAHYYGGGGVSVLGMSDGTLYRTEYGQTDGGYLVRSRDLGDTWESVEVTWPDGLRDFSYLVEITPDIIGRAVRDGFIISSDSGATWRSLSIPFDMISWPVMTDDGRLWASERRDTPDSSEFDVNVYVSADTGRTWSLCDVSLPLVQRDGTMFGLQGGHLLRADACGSDPVEIPGVVSNVRIRSLTTDESGGIFAEVQRFVADYDLYRSLDRGETWERIVPNVRRSPQVDRRGNLYLPFDTIIWTDQGSVRKPTTVQKLFRSTDRGDSWSPVFHDSVTFDGRTDLEIQSTPEGITLLVPRPERSRTSTELPVVYLSPDGINFAPIDGWTDTGAFRPLDLQLFDDGSILATGSRWKSRAEWIDNGFIELDAVTGEERWIGGPEGTHSISSEGGLFAWGRHSIYRIDRATETFTSIPPPGNDPLQKEVMMRGAYLYSWTGTRDIWSTTDEGKTWESVEEKVTEWSSVQGALFQWHQLDPPLPARPDGTLFDLVSVFSDDPRRTGNDDAYVFRTLARSTDDGHSWDYPVGEELELKDITSLVFSGETVIVGTAANGIYRADFPSGVEDEIRIAPDDLHLAISPNPVVDKAKISFYLDHTSDQEVTLTLYDLLGRRVDVLYRGAAEQGSYPVDADFSRLASGAYFLRVQRGGEGRTEGFVLRR